jgi:uncharacterized protein
MAGSALVTGASSGIGREFARLLAERGYDLILVARREDRITSLASELEAAHGTKAITAPEDLGDPEAPQRLFDRANEAGAHVEVLVNAAGLTPAGRYLESDWETHSSTLNVMGVAPLHLTHLFLPAMLERGSGHVINVSSVGAWYTSTPTQTLYGPSKAMVLRFTQSLADEYPDRGVSFTTVAPGVTDTEILDVPFNEAAVKGIPKRMIDSPRKVAEAGWRAAQRNRTVVVTGPTGKSAHMLMRLLPEAISTKLMARQLTGAYDESRSEQEEGT